LDDNEIGAKQQVVSDVQNTTNRLTDSDLNEKFQKTPSNGGVSSLSKSKTGIKST
jgi:hypothetical protein